MKINKEIISKLSKTTLMFVLIKYVEQNVNLKEMEALTILFVKIRQLVSEKLLHPYSIRLNQ